MCIMEVRAGQRKSTISQACAHNLFTVVGDTEMFRTLLEGRARAGDPTSKDRLDTLDALEVQLRDVYQGYLDLYGHFVADEVFEDPDAHTHDHDHDHGSERTIVDPILANAAYAGVERRAEQIAHEDEHRARKYETR